MIASGEWWHVQTHEDFFLVHVMKEIILWDLKLQTRPLLMFHCSIVPTLAILIFFKYDIFIPFFFNRTKNLLLKKASFFKKFYFLTLCLQDFHNGFLLLNKESMLDPITDTFSTHGSAIGPGCHVFHFRQPYENFRSHSIKSTKSAWAHISWRFWCFPVLLGKKVNSSITRGLGWTSFIRGCTVGQPSMVCQTLDHSECWHIPSREEYTGVLSCNHKVSH